MTHISEIPAGTLVKQAHAGVKLIAEQYPEAAAVLREAITRFDVLREVHQLAKQEAQPVIPERPELRYGDNVLWFLNKLAAFDASDIDSDDFDVYGEDRNGIEGCATISITELAADAAKLLSAQPVSEPYKLISVKDDTPTASGDYWCYLGKDFESPTKYRVVHFDVRHHEFQDHRVTHWMRLPAEPAQEV